MRARLGAGVVLGLACPAFAQMSAEEVQQCVWQCNANNDTQDDYFACVEERCNDSSGGAGAAQGYGDWHVGDGANGRYAGVILPDDGLEGEGGIPVFCQRDVAVVILFDLGGGEDVAEMRFTIDGMTSSRLFERAPQEWWETRIAADDPFLDRLETGNTLRIGNLRNDFWTISLTGSGTALSQVRAGC